MSFSGGGGSQTPWRQNIDAAGFTLNNVSYLLLQRPNDSGVILRLSSGAVYGYDFTRSEVTGHLLIQGDQPAANNICLCPTTGNLGVGVASPIISGTGKIHGSGNTARITDASRTPANSAAPGNDGEICYDNSFIYVHTGGSWRRAALATF